MKIEDPSLHKVNFHSGQLVLLKFLHKQKTILGLLSTDSELIFVLENAELIRFFIENEKLNVVCDLSVSVKQPSFLPETLIGGVPRNSM